MEEIENFVKRLNRKEHPFKSIYPLADRIYSFLKKYLRVNFIADKEIMERVYVNEDAEFMTRAEACKTISNMLVLILATIVLIALTLLGKSGIIGEGNRIARSDTGEGKRRYELVVSEEESDWSTAVDFSVSEKKVSEDRLDPYFEQAYLQLEKQVLGENAAESVCDDLNLVSEIAGTEIKVTWPDLDHKYIFSTGRIRFSELEEPIMVCLTARLEYYDEVRFYSFYVRLIPKEKSEAELFMDKLTAMLKSEDRATADSEWFYLPQSVNGKAINWSEKQQNTWLMVAGFGLTAAVAVIPLSKSEIRKKDKKREEQMLRDYPDIISKFVLLVTAGMTCRMAWSKICSDYLANKTSERYAYEEMLKSEREMKFGRSEKEVYERFGKRCGIRAYRKFGMLLSNNIKRGSRELLGMLEAESEEAFSDRRDTIKTKAQEAGTKLLLPMFGMLCLVFAIILVPALSSFGG